MSSPSVTDILSILSYPATIFLFCSQFPLMREFILDRELVQYSSYLPTIATFLNCTLWAIYGLEANLSSVFYINLVGAIIQLIYAAFFISLGNDKTRRSLILSLASTIGIVAAFVVSTLYVNARNASQILAYAAIAANIFMFGAPLSSLYDAFIRNDVSRVPVFLNIMSLLCSSIWSAYGMLIDNLFIAGPNIFGSILTLLQLLAVGVISYKKVSTEKETVAMKKISSGIDINKQVNMKKSSSSSSTSSLSSSSSSNMLLSTSASSESLVRLDEEDEYRERENSSNHDVGIDIGLGMEIGEGNVERSSSTPTYPLGGGGGGRR